MSQVRLISTGAHRYNGVWLKSGDPFVANSERDADELCCTGFAQRAPAPKDHTYDTRVLVAESPTASSAGDDKPREKRAYKRRDQSAR